GRGGVGVSAREGTGVTRAWVALGALLAASPALAQQRHLVVITGISGDAAHAATFSRWASTMIDAVENRWGLPKANVVYLAEDSAVDPTRVTGRSTREGIEHALAQLGQRVRPDDAVLILLIGHGSASGT